MDLNLTQKINDCIANKDVDMLRSLIAEHDLEIKDGKIIPSEKIIAEVKDEYAFWDQRQLIKKIQLNSLLIY